MHRCFVVVLTLAGCGQAVPESAPPVERPPVREARSAETRWVRVESADELSWLEAPARAAASPNAGASISAPLEARIVRVRVRPGQHVEEGEPLLDVVMPELIRAAGALRAADIQIDAYRAQRAKLEPLLAQNLARASDVAELDVALASARSARESARATLRAAGEPDARAPALLDGSGTVSLRAPLSAMVSSVSAQLGQVRAPTAGPLLELVAEQAVQIEARFVAAPPAGSRFEWLEHGRKVPLELDALSPQAGADGARLAWLRVAEGQASPVAGALGRVRVVSPGEWVVVPVGALREERGETHVEVKSEAGSAASPVALVQRSESEAVVTGLRAGMLIAADARRAHAP